MTDEDARALCPGDSVLFVTRFSTSWSKTHLGVVEKPAYREVFDNTLGTYWEGWMVTVRTGAMVHVVRVEDLLRRATEEDLRAFMGRALAS